MSTIVYDQEFETDLDRIRETIATELEECARQLRAGDSECKLYLGGTVFAHLDFDEEPGITIEA